MMGKRVKHTKSGKRISKDSLSKEKLYALFDKLRLHRPLTQEEKKLRIPNFEKEYKKYFKSLPLQIQQEEQMEGMLQIFEHLYVLKEAGRVVTDLAKSAFLDFYKKSSYHFRNQVKDFIKSPEEQKLNAGKGGKAKFDRNYLAFCDWAAETGFSIEDHKNDSNENFLTAIKSKGFNKTKSPKTADGYRKAYLKKYLR